MSKMQTVYANRLDSMTQNNKDFLNKIKPSQENKEVKNKAAKDMLKRMGNDDNKAIENYKNALVSNTSFLVEEQLIFADFFNRGTMVADEREWYYTLDEPITDNQARIYQISQHGNTPTQGIVLQGDMVFVTPYWISGEEVSMSRFNLRRGDIANERKMRERSARGMVKKIETDAKSLLDNGLITSNLKDIAGIEIEQGVNDFPNKTVYDLSTEGSITMNVFKEIFKHFMLLGKRVMNIYVPASRVTDLWDWMSIPSGYAETDPVDANSIVPQFIRDQIIKTGTVNNLFGYPVNLIPVNSLNGNAANGSVDIWVRAYEGCGEYRVFPEPISSTYSHRDAQKVYFSENKALSMFQVPAQRLNYAKFTIA